MRSALLYLVLVVTPLLGLMAILHAGERLTAPRSVGGTWQLDDQSSTALARWCRAKPASQPATMLAVSQSGSYLELAFDGWPRRPVSARLDGVTLIGAFALSDRASCPGETVELAARVSDGERMTVTLHAPACLACPALKLDAMRPPPPPPSDH